MTYAVYYRWQNFGFQDIVLDPIIGGVEEVISSDVNLNPVFFFYPTGDGPDDYRFFINRLDDGTAPCRTFTLDTTYISIIASESDFNDQEMELIPQSLYVDPTMGIVGYISVMFGP